MKTTLEIILLNRKFVPQFYFILAYNSNRHKYYGYLSFCLANIANICFSRELSEQSIGNYVYFILQ